MQELHVNRHFIGRTNEIDTFMDWLHRPDAPWIFSIFDAFEEAEKKGGIGKSWLLRKCVELIEQEHPDVAVVMIDFFNLGDRDGITIAERVVAGLQRLYPGWTPTAFNEALEQYRADENAPEISGEISSENVSDYQIRETVSAGLQADITQLNQSFGHEQKTLLLIFDTYEVVEQNPAVAVLRLAQSFPDTYHFEHMKVVIAGRNRLNWTHLNWIGREHEVFDYPLRPFNHEEMRNYLEVEAVLGITPQDEQLQDLYERTQGRPILVGLVADVLSHHILTLPQLLAVTSAKFEGYLVAQVNNLENPLNWVILLMAHIYDRFNLSILDWILQETDLKDLTVEIEHLQLLTALPQLSFVRQPSTGSDFVLHDEMRRLVVKHCWEIQDPNKDSRREISRSVMNYYAQKMALGLSEHERQTYIVETLYHSLFNDLDEGFRYFQQHYQDALRLSKNGFARLLFQEIQKFRGSMMPSQQDDLQLAEARLLRKEENAFAALQTLEQLEQSHDLNWYTDHRNDLLMEEGLCYLRLSKLTEAAHKFGESLQIEEARGEELRSAHLLANLGSTARERGLLTEALNYYRRGGELFKKLGLQDGYANTLTTVSTIYRLQGKTREALQRCKIALRIRQELYQEGRVSEVKVGLSLSAIGVIYVYTNNIMEAENYLNAAFEIYQRTNYKKGIATSYLRLGQTELAKGRLREARNWFQKAQEASLAIHDIQQYINSLNKQGRLCVQQEQDDEANALFKQAAEEARTLPDYVQQVENLVDYAGTLSRLGAEAEATRVLQEAETIALREDYVNWLGSIERIRGEIAYHTGDYTQAFQHFATYCRHMTSFNALEFDNALTKTTDTLLELPRDEVPAIVEMLKTYWQTQQLDREHPELLTALMEVNDLMVP